MWRHDHFVNFSSVGRLCLEKSAGSFGLEVCMGGGMYTAWMEVQPPSGEQKKKCQDSSVHTSFGTRVQILKTHAKAWGLATPITQKAEMASLGQAGLLGWPITE